MIFPEAVRVSAQVLAIRGRIFPSTAQNVTLEAELEDGTIVAGETNISRSRQRIRRVRLVPHRVRPLPEVLEAIREADLILVGPGSLYTSIIPNLLVEQVTETIAHSRATCVYIANLMTQPGETQHYSVADHVCAIYDHTRKELFDFAVINRRPIPRRVAQALSHSRVPSRCSLRPRSSSAWACATSPAICFASQSRCPARSGAADAAPAGGICEAPRARLKRHAARIGRK